MNEDTKNNLNKERGSRLRECREYRHLTQERLSELVNLSTNYVSMLERGERPIDWDKAVMFSEALDVSPSFVMCVHDVISVGDKQKSLDFYTRLGEKHQMEETMITIPLYEYKYLIQRSERIKATEDYLEETKDYMVVGDYIKAILGIKVGE